MAFGDRRRRRICAAGIAGIVVAAAGCGSSGDSSSSTTAAGKSKGATSKVDATIAKYSGAVTWPGPSASVTPPSGKKITIITCGSQGTTCVRVANGAKAAAQALGYQATVVDGQSQPAVWNQAIRSALATKTDGIVLAAVPPALVTGALATAKQDGVPVASVLSVLGPATDVRVSYDRTQVARANSAFMARDSGGKANVLVARDAEFPETLPTTKAYPAALAAACSGCKVAKTVDFSLALASQRLASTIATALRNDPSINYVTTPFDGVVPFVVQGIAQAGRAGKVKIVGVGADPESIAAIKSGSEVESFGTPAEWMGWDAVDGLVRVMAKQEVPAVDSTITGGASNYLVPGRIVTKEQATDPKGWQGGFDYQTKFRALWGK